MDNMNEIAALLHIQREATAHGSMLDNIAKAALKELREIDAGLAPKAEAVQIGEPPPAVEPGEPLGDPNRKPEEPVVPSGEPTPTPPVEPPSRPVNEEPASPPAETAQPVGGLDESHTELQQPTGGVPDRRI